MRVRGFEILDQHSGTTCRARIAMDYAEKGSATLPDTMFVKIAPTAIVQRLFLTITGIGQSEVLFYRDVRKDVPVRAPAVYAAQCAGSGRSFAMLLEDLDAAGARFARVGDRVGAAQAACVVDELARLHAAFWESERFRGDLAWVPCYESRQRDLPWERFVTGQMLGLAVRKFADDLGPSLREIGSLCVNRRDHLERLWAEGPRTFVHGDCHVGNLFFEGDGVGFLDWQVCARAPGMRDVSYFLCNSCPTKLRREQERDLIGAYLSRLSELGVDAPSFETAWMQHRRFALYTWVAAAFTAAAGGGLQAVETGVAGLRRTTTACADLESVDAAMSELETLR